MSWTLFNIFLATNIMSGCLSFYLGHRGLTGVSSDLKDVKASITKIESKLNGQTPVAPIAPVVDGTN